ncbi:MAG TPA: metal transporter, partial [Desulfosarcina sp.]|nr:metal transporter [Desulfosarcina sp.]
PADTLAAYMGLFNQNMALINRSVDGALAMISRYTASESTAFISALSKSVWQLDAGDLQRVVRRQARLMQQVAMAYPAAIASIEAEYGFHFERGIHPLVDETNRFRLYRIMPSQKEVAVDPSSKPVCIIPPYVLGANILGFLPGERRSYAHCFADQGIPTYIRILKEIGTTEALQTMSAEDDARDTAQFCRTIKAQHGRPVTLNGYCQGGYNALCAVLSGILDDLVDAFITCVAPMDGTRSRGLSDFLKKLPPRFNDLAYGTKTLANGNQVADGTLMGWVYKLKSIESESPLAAFYRDLLMFAAQKEGPFRVGKTAAALNYWLGNERNDLPMDITRVSFAAFNTPIAADGTLPVTLFGGRLNLNRIREKAMPWLICYGVHDDLVEKDCALAPLDHVGAEVTPFPKGHVAIATSWSHPQSDYALHKRYDGGRHRGPVRFHLDLERRTGIHTT